MVIDSKVSLTAYSRYVAAESDEERSRFAREHLESVLKHVKELAEKQSRFRGGCSRLCRTFYP